MAGLASRVLVAAALLFCAVDAAADCDGPLIYLPDPDLEGVDTTPPTAPRIRGVHVERATEPVLRDHFTFGESCGGGPEAGRIVVRVDPAVDDHADMREIGYRLEHVDGSLPRGFFVLEHPYLLDGRDEVVIHVPPADDDEVYDFRLRFVPVDTAGNEGPPSAPFRVHDEGVGCAAGGGGLAPGGLFAALALLRRRRR